MKSERMSRLFVRVRGWTLLACIFASAASVAVAQEAKIVEFSPAGDVADWALDDASGRVFASIYDGSKVIELDPNSGQQIREFTVAEKPKHLVIKAGKLVAAVEGGVSLYIIDLKTNQVDGRVQLAGKGPNVLFCSRAKNPYVYAICNTGTAWWDGEVFQVDVLQRKSGKSVKVQGWSQSHVMHSAMSPDGKWMVVDARGASSPSRADLMSVDEEACTFTSIFGHHDSFGQIQSDATGRFWTLGSGLYTQDIRSKIRQFRGNLVALHPSLDLAVSVGAAARPWEEAVGGSLAFETFSGPELLKEVKIGEQQPEGARRNVRRPAAGEGRWADDPTLQFDVIRERVFYGHRNKAYLVDLKSLDLKAKPLLLLDVPSAADVNIGQAVKIPVALTDPKLTASAKLTLESAPKGVTLTNGQLTWTPQSEDVGDQKVVIKAAREGSTDMTTVTIHVRRPSIALGGTINDLQVDLEGNRALAVVTLAQDPRRPRQPDQFGQMRSERELLIIDLKTMQITARRKFDEPLAATVLTGQYVCIAPQNVTRVHKLKLADLSDDGRFFTNGNVSKMELLPWGDVALFSSGGVQRFDGQRLSPAGWIAPNHANGFYDGSEQQAVSRLNGAVAVGPMVVDVQSNSMRMLRRAPGIPSIASDPQGQQMMHMGGGNASLGLWGRRVMGAQLMGPANAVIAQLGQGQSLILEAFPAVVTLTSSTEGNARASKILQLDFRDLVEGTRTDPLVLSQSAVDQRGGYNPYDQYGSSNRMIERKGTLYVGAEQRLYVIALPADRLKKLPAPLYFVQKMDPFLAPVKASVQVKVAIEGGKGAKTFELPGSPEGTSIDPKTGAITIDTNVVWKKHLEQISPQMAMNYASTQPATGPIDQAQAAYKGLFSRDSGGAYPLAVHLRAIVTDAENQKAELSGYVVLLGSAKEAADAIAKRQNAEVPPEFAGMSPRGRRPMTQPFAHGDEQDDPAALHQRIQELERRNEQLESQIEVLKDLLRDRSGQPATRRAR